ncbi:hypothetical protein gpAD87_28965 [Paenibacillus sp. AD87]|nr:hypothetical protein gpAD87_28965 [Paenibacillus sp. AD87]
MELPNLYNEETDGVKFDTLNRICEALNCEIQEIIEFIKDEK